MAPASSPSQPSTKASKRHIGWLAMSSQYLRQFLKDLGPNQLGSEKSTPYRRRMLELIRREVSTTSRRILSPSSTDRLGRPPGRHIVPEQSQPRRPHTPAQLFVHWQPADWLGPTVGGQVPRQTVEHPPATRRCGSARAPARPCLAYTHPIPPQSWQLVEAVVVRRDGRWPDRLDSSSADRGGPGRRPQSQQSESVVLGRRSIRVIVLAYHRLPPCGACTPLS